jgi:acyl-CoA reductase-like NAD-dependent aldehyde dehydrogenase
MGATGTRAAIEYRMFVDGEWVAAASGETYETTSPATGEVIGTIPQGDRDDARRAIAAANRAFDGWSRLTAFERAAKMHAVGDAIERRRDELARILTLDQGKPLHAEAYGEVDELVEYWRMAAEDAKRLGGGLPNSFSPGKRVMLVRRARGAVGVITPWNWPYTMPAELLAPSLACGNTVVWTPAPTTAVCAVALAECMAEADLPPGVVNLVTGPGPVVGDEIARNPGTRAVAFIGSTATGRSVASAAAGKAVIIEMGGNGPLVVMDDADLERAVEATVTACFLCAGQSCTAGERILVQKGVRDEFVDRLARRVAETVLLGDPFDAATTMGPLNNAGVAIKMDEHVADALARGAEVAAGGARATGFPTDLYWPATILSDVPADARASVEETFGPIAPVVSIASLDEAIELTNTSQFGLLSAIFTRDLAAGLRFADEVRTGWVNINESSNYWEAHLPFGGRSGTDSGIGRVGGNAVMETFTELQTVVLTP